MSPAAIIPVADGADGALALPDGAQRDPVGLYLATLRTAKSRSTALDSLRRALRTLYVETPDVRAFPWASLTVSHTMALDARLARSGAPATHRLTRACVRGVLRACWKLELLDGEAFLRLTAWPRILAKSAPVGRALSREEIATLRAACEQRKPFEAAYQWAILACGVGAGFRRDEIAGLAQDALSDDARHVRVLGKGQKERIHPVPASVGAALESWLAQRARLELETMTMFPWVRRGTLTDRAATPWLIWRVIRDIRERTEIAPFTPHDLRRTYATHWIRTKDLAAAQKLMRHEDPKTTIRYDRRSDDELASIVDEIDPLLGG